MTRSLRIISYCFASIAFIGCSNTSNQLKVDFGKDIIKKDAAIKMEILGDAPITEILNGEKEFPIPNGYGENEWYFIYQDSLKGYTRHIKLNRNDKHNYHFTFHKVKEKYFVDIDISGDSPLKQTVELKLK